MSIAIYTQGTIETLAWRACYGDGSTEKYLRALVRHQPSYYIDNVREEMVLLTVDEAHAIPLVINHGGSRRCYITSNTANFIGYAGDAVNEKIKGPVAKMGIRALLVFIKLVFQLARIDRAVYINCWLLPTGKNPAISHRQLERITAYLRSAYPRHALVYKGINMRPEAPRLDGFQATGYLPVMSRIVYLWEPSEKNCRKSDVKKGLKLLHKTDYILLDNDRLHSEHVDRLCDLYKQLYADKHSQFSIQYNRRWFELAVKSHFLHINALARDGRLDSCACTFFDDGFYVSSLGVFDQVENRRHKGLLYSLNFAMKARLSRAEGIPINLSSGGDTFKKNRGASGVFEYDAVFCRHLGRHARWVWTGFIALYNSLGKKIYTTMVGT